MIEQYFLVNKLDENLVIKQGYVTIGPKGSFKITQHDMTDATILYALGKDWVEIVKDQPVAELTEKDVPITVTQPYEGMTEAELKASKENAPPAVEPGITSALGQNTTVEIDPQNPAITTALGQEEPKHKAPRAHKKAV